MSNRKPPLAARPGPKGNRNTAALRGPSLAGRRRRGPEGGTRRLLRRRKSEAEGEPARPRTIPITHKKSPRSLAGFFSSCGNRLLGDGGSLLRGLGGSGGGDVFLDAGSLAFQATQVVQLRAADLTLTLHFDRVDSAAVGLEHALHAGAVRDLAHGEGGMQAAAALGNDDTFERLDALAVTFLDLDVDDHGVARTEIRQLAGDLLGFELFEKFVHGTPVTIVYGDQVIRPHRLAVHIHGGIHPAMSSTQHRVHAALA